MRKQVTNQMRIRTQQAIDRIRELKAESLGITVDEYIKRCKYLATLKEES